MFDASNPVIRVKPVDRISAAQVILDPEIYDRVSSDKSPPRTEFTLPDLEYWGGFVNGDIASIYTEDPFMDGLKIHFQVLKQYRFAARELLSLSLPHNERLYCMIPECFKTTINFAKNAGFKLIEIKKDDYPKYGRLQDRYILRLDHVNCR